MIPLHVRSHHSWCLGTASPEELVCRAAQHRLSALALTDADTLHAQPYFQKLCLAAGVRPIVGAELRRPTSPTERLVLLVKNPEGYANLCRIISVRGSGADFVGDPVHALAGDARGLFVMSDDPTTLARVLEAGAVERGDLRLLLVRPSEGDERPILEAADRLGVALVADPELAVLDPNDQAFAALLVAALGNRRIADLEARELEFSRRWFRSPDEQAELFADLPEAIEETVRIAEQCRFRFVRRRPVLPGADAFGGTEPELALERRCRRALGEARARGCCTASTYDMRLADELSVVRELGYAGYFLIAAEIVDLAKQRDIAIAARGSAVGSLIVHLLGASPIDPVSCGLYFERFLHARRKSPPDIDLDVCARPGNTGTTSAALARPGSARSSLRRIRSPRPTPGATPCSRTSRRTSRPTTSPSSAARCWTTTAARIRCGRSPPTSSAAVSRSPCHR